MQTVTVSNSIMRDLLSAKSKLNEIWQFVEDYSDVLKEAELYDEIMRILTARVYDFGSERR